VRWLNGKIEISTIWEMTLHRLHTQIGITDLQQAEVLHEWALIVKSFLEHNTDLEATCRICENPKKLGENYSVCSIIEAVFKYSAPADAAMLLRVLEQ
jgi:hypothetical protein